MRESFDDATGRFRIRVRVVNRHFGPLFGYEGTFRAVTSTRCATAYAPGSAPYARRPGMSGDGAGTTPDTKKPTGADTRVKLLEGALRTLAEQGIAKTSARSVAAAAGVNQALVFYHFGSVDELLAAACRYGAEQRVALHRDRLAAVTTLAELVTCGRELHEQERAGGQVAFLAQLLAGAQTQPRLAPATAAGLDLWTAEIEKVLVRVLAGSPLGEFTDPLGLARAVAGSFVGLELY